MTKLQHKYFSKNNPRPTPIGYKVEPNRKQFPVYLFDKKHGNQPIAEAMEDFYKRNYHYPVGITPIYEEIKSKKEEK
jgi:hypothetical protein